MLQLIYASTASAEWDADLQALCEQAARNNGRDEVTGMLLFHERSFLQVLEGPQATVEDTFLRIITDPRHHSLTLLSRQSRVSRQFGDWAMVCLSGNVDKRTAIDRVGAMIRSAPAHILADFDTRFGP